MADRRHRATGTGEQTSRGTNAGALWGGRFAGGPSPELEALSRAPTSTGGWRPTTSPGRGRTPVLHAARAAQRRRAGRAARAASTR